MLAKLDVPELGPTMLRRPRLLDRLTAGVQGRVTVVCAPAGSGKTTLALSWVDAGLAAGPLVWISLDALDRRPGIFWTYLHIGLTRAGVATEHVPAPIHPYRLDPSMLMHLSAALYQRTEPVVVVLDNADAVAGSPVCGQLDFLLRNAGPSLHLVLLTRDEPAVPLARYRLAGTVTEVGAADLAATPAEAAALFELKGFRPPAETVDGLVHRTRGWLAGLVLSGLALRDREQLPGAARGGSRIAEDLEEYLDEEVLAAYPVSVRRFLVRTSVADHLAAGLAEELAGQPGAARLLAELAHHNTFVTCCDEHVDCYRYHPLLNDVLRARLEEDSEAAVPQLNRRAAAWFVRAGEPGEAAVHAARAGEWLMAVKVLVGGFGVARLLTGPGSGRLSWPLAELPADVPGAEAAIVRAAIALLRGDTAGCAAQLASARELAPETPEPGLAVSTCVIAAGLAAATGDARAALAAAESLEKLLVRLPESDRLAATHLLVLTQAARALLETGRTDAALAMLADARHLGPPGCDDLRATCTGLTALAEAMRGRSSRAIELATPDAGRPSGQRSPAARAALAWGAADTGQPALARGEVAALTPADAQDQLVATAAAIVLARLRRQDGDAASAPAVLDAARLPPTDPAARPWLDARLAAETAAAWTAAGRPEVAVRALADLGPAAGIEVALELARARLAGGGADAAEGVEQLLHSVDLPLGVRVEALLLRATYALERGDTAAAASAADRALRTAAPERLRRPFLEAPPRLRGFLRHHRDLSGRHGWLEEVEPPRPAQPVRVAPPVRKHADRTVLVEPLTEKEHEVLVNLAELLSTEEIARQMYVSVNTVRTHVRAILRKLAATRRNEAIRHAREIGII
ncbi:MAG TPA: LuxR C-terminal-related transcriptional regulator [Mycobacteriales bacterium]|nr:LuxR C-terminal-related transcriptional regulator [Mycobacteriales bacterium]